MNALPVDVAALEREAVESFPAAMLDDPTTWPEGSTPDKDEVVSAVLNVVRDNFRSLLARRIGPHVQNIATDMDGAVAEDGPLADLESIWTTYVQGFAVPGLDAVAKAADWDARVEVLSALVSKQIASVSDPKISDFSIDAYVASDPRLTAVISAPAKAEPGAAGASGFSWDDEDEEAAPAPARTVNPDGTLNRENLERAVAAIASLPAGETRPTPLLFQLLEPVGVLATDFADITGINKATVSNAKNGKRVWSGLSEKQAERLAVELDARAEAALALSKRLRAMEPAVVDGNKV